MTQNTSHGWTKSSMTSTSRRVASAGLTLHLLLQSRSWNHVVSPRTKSMAAQVCIIRTFSKIWHFYLSLYLGEGEKKSVMILDWTFYAILSSNAVINFADYERITEANAECNRITTEAECNKAATDLKLDDQNARVWNIFSGSIYRTKYPPNCYTTGTYLYFNKNVDGNTAPCTKLRSCVCKI